MKAAAVLALLLLQLSSAAPALGVTPRNAGALVGQNLERLGPAGRTWVFVDVFKTANDWSAQNLNGTPWVGTPLDVDSLGWPRSLQPNQAAVTRILQAMAGHYPAGQYVALYDGTGTVDFGGDASVVSTTPGRVVLQITPSPTGFTRIRITSTSVADPIRNIRVIMPGFESSYATQVFHPAFLSRLSPFKVIRFLNWTLTNNSTITSWSQRTRPESATQGGVAGVAPEYMVALCNRLGADAWVNIPHLADDDYVIQWAQLLRDSMAPDLRIFVEHSNELWGTFQQSDYARAQGLALGLSSDPNTAALRWNAQRSVHLFALFDSVFAGDRRVVRVLAGLHPNPTLGVAMLDWQNAYQHADVYATAPYFGGQLGSAASGASTAAMSVAQLLAALDQQSLVTQAFAATQAANAAARGLGYVAYEGGQALYGQSGWQNDSSFTNRIMAANRDAGMRPLYAAHFSRWRAAGGGLFMNFNFLGSYTGGGCWGGYESMTQDSLTAYKLLGVMDYMIQNTLDAPSGGPARALQSLHVSPAPIRSSCAIQGALPRAGRLTIALYDTQGRQLEQVSDGWQDAGAFNIAWRPARTHAAGVYWLRASGPGGVLSSRVVMLR